MPLTEGSFAHVTLAFTDTEVLVLSKRHTKLRRGGEINTEKQIADLKLHRKSTRLLS